jgi:hypothetical protein
MSRVGASQSQIPPHLDAPLPGGLDDYGGCEAELAPLSAYDEDTARKRATAAKIMERIADDDAANAKRPSKQSDENGTDEVSDQQRKALDELNEKYAVVNDSGKVVVFRRTRDQVLNRFLIERSSFDDFKRLYQNRNVPIATKRGKPPEFMPLGQFWLKNARRRQYAEGVTFDPTDTAPPGKWNMWAGFPTAPAHGDWSLMREHIRAVICNGDRVRFQYLMAWLARMFQKPSLQGEVAVVMRGKEGCGKGTLGKALVRAWGQHAIHITNAKHLVGNFNSHLRDCVFVFADEAFFAGDKQHIGALNAIITEPTIMVEPKGRDAITAPNMTHIMMASNNDWVVPARGEARRYLVLDVSDTKIGNAAYFDAINDQMQSGGLAAMIYDLRSMDISEFRVTKFPITAALDDQKTRSMKSHEAWLASVLQRGYVWRSRHGASVFMKWSEITSTELLYQSYLQHCGDVREQRPIGKEAIGTFLNGIYEKRRPRGEAPIHEIDVPEFVAMKDRPPGYYFGPLTVARAKFVKESGLPVQWPDEEKDEPQADDRQPEDDLPF